jgi:hypothetical protein
MVCEPKAVETVVGCLLFKHKNLTKTSFEPVVGVELTHGLVMVCSYGDMVGMDPEERERTDEAGALTPSRPASKV